MGGHHAAGTASVGVEVDYDGEAGFPGVFFDEAVEFVRGANVSDERSGVDGGGVGEEEGEDGGETPWGGASRSWLCHGWLCVCVECWLCLGGSS